MDRVGQALRWVVRSALVTTCGLAASCIPSDFDALSSANNGVATRESCATSADATACDNPEPIDASPPCGPCAAGQTCMPCPDAQSGDPVAGAAATVPREASVPSCPAGDPSCAEQDAEVCENCRDSAAADPDPVPEIPPCEAQSRECEPGNVENEMQPCGACNSGVQTRSRSCDPESCSWSGWSEYGACTGVTAACTPGATTACANGDSCGHRVCTAACTWSGCQPRTAGGCLRIRAGHTDEGSNYRCCGTGAWQFCLSSCTWSAQCAGCSAGAPDYCSDCYPGGQGPKDGEVDQED